MSLLSVVIDDGRNKRVVTRNCSELTFTNVAPGGFQQASMRLNLPRDAFTDLGPADRVYIYDPRTGDTLFEGWAQNPGPVDGRSGQSWRLTAIGNAALATDQAEPWIYIDGDYQAWKPDDLQTVPPGAIADIRPVPTGGPEGILVGFPAGLQFPSSGIQASMGYRRLFETGQRLGTIHTVLKSGKVSADYRAQLVWTPPNGAAHIGSAIEINTTWTEQTRVAGAGEFHPPTTADRVALRIVRTGASGVEGDNDAWTFFAQVQVTGNRYDRFGNQVAATTYSSPKFVRAHEVVADIVGRMLPLCPGDLAYIETPVSAYPIDQLAFTDAATPAEVFDALLLWEPDMTWEILETVPGRGCRFAWRSWGSTHRYEFSTVGDGIEAPGGDVDLCNEIVVEWLTSTGVTMTRTVRVPVPALDAQGRTRQAPTIRLRDGLGSAANAQRAGELTLAEVNTPSMTGTAQVMRRVYDRLERSWVAPWEIKQGYTALIRERGITVHVTEVEWDDDNATMTCTLGTPPRKREQRELARLVGSGRAA